MFRSPKQAVGVLVLTLAGTFMLFGCDGLGSSTAEGPIEIGFQTVTSSSASSANATSKRAASRAGSKATSDSLQVVGQNGTLQLTDIRLIVSETELEGRGEETEFETGASVLDLSLDTSQVSLSSAQRAPTGSYTTLEFEVENLEVEDDDPGEEEDEGQNFDAILTEARDAYANWPRQASMVATGTFVPNGGSPQSFTTFFDAEIEVERTLNPPLQVTQDGTPRSLTIQLNPSRWFQDSGNKVRDLSQVDYAYYQETGRLPSLEFENGVADVDSDDDDDDDDDDDY